MDDKMESRVEAAIGTWMQNPNPLVKIEIFANNNGSVDPVKKFRSSYLKNGFRVLQLPGVSDHVYPPQKKSFSMVKFMHDEYLHRYVDLENIFSLIALNIITLKNLILIKTKPGRS